MVSMESDQKVRAEHLKRNAYLYIRQSTPRQVLENTESTKRQYALQQRAVALGNPALIFVSGAMPALSRHWRHSPAALRSRAPSLARRAGKR